MPTLEEIKADRLQRELLPERQSSVKPIKDSQKAVQISTQKNIPIEQAKSSVLLDNIDNFIGDAEQSPAYQEAEKLLDVFDPTEPPEGGEGISDPIGDLMKLELAAIREPAKVALKALGFVFSPIDRAFKFVANATMFDPLTKSAAAPTKRLALTVAIENEINRRVGSVIDKAKQDETISDEAVIEMVNRERPAIVEAVNTDASESLKQIQSDPAKVQDFLSSGKDALKALVPWPGFADDVQDFGEIGADSFKRIVGRDAPWYYAPVSNIALETTALVGLMKLASTPDARDVQSAVRAAKLTKAERRAIKKLHKQAGIPKKAKVGSNVVPTEEEAAHVTNKLVALVKKAKPARDKKALLLHEQRQRNARKLMRVQRNAKGQKLAVETKGALKGAAPLPDFTPLNIDLTTTEIDTLFNLINNSQISAGFDKGRAFLSLDKLLGGNLITKSEIGNLEQVFGKALTKALFNKQSVASMIQDLSFEIINLPRAVLASYDLSAGLRQGIIFSVSHPRASMKAFGRSIRAAGSLQYADDIERATKFSRFGKLADKFGVHSSPTGFSARIAAKEEVYMSRIAEKIPGVAQSERAFTTFLNQQRREVFTVQAKQWIKRGITPENNQKTYQQFAKFVNHATGRGSLETMKPGALTALNATFFSPRFQVSRVQVMGDLVNPRTTALARKAIARDLAEFYATGLGIMALAEMGGAEVEKDPRSSDFGKIKVGNTRYNYWGAFQPLASLAGRMYAGEIKSTGTGKIKDKNRANIIATFLRTKLAPVPGFGVDAILGETFDGQPVEATKEFAGKALYRSLTPLFVQDSIDAWKFQGADAQFPISAGLAFTGIGVQTWEVAPFAELELAKDSLSRQTYGKNYDQLSFSEATFLDRDILVNHPGLVDLERQIKFEAEGVNFLKKQAIELRKSERRLTKRLDKKLLADLEIARLRVGGVDRVIGKWRLNDEQYKEYQERVAKNVNEIFLETKPLWDTKTTEGKYELMSTILRSAKSLSASEMKIGDPE